MSYYLFLDDVRNPRDVKWVQLPYVPWIVVRNYDEFVKVITQRGLPEYITYDHDLADTHYPKKPQNGNEIIEYDQYKEKTGYHCAQWLVNYCMNNNVKLPKFSVHSMNVVGRKNIIQLLGNFATFQSQNP